jgi:hypothetical protein
MNFTKTVNLLWGDYQVNIVAKALGYYSGYSSYWLALSLISDGVEESRVEKLLTHLEKWSDQHTLLKPRLLHLQAELACRTSVTEAWYLVDVDLIGRQLNFSM